jgi:hypothetical protein
MTWRKREIMEMAREVDVVTQVLLDRKATQKMEHDVFVLFLERFAKLVREEQQTEVQRLIALVKAQQITIDKLEAALAQPEQEPVACKHEWFRTGAMQLWEYRCINCGAEAKLMEKNNDS